MHSVLFHKLTKNNQETCRLHWGKSLYFKLKNKFQLTRLNKLLEDSTEFQVSNKNNLKD